MRFFKLLIVVSHLSFFISMSQSADSGKKSTNKSIDSLTENFKELKEIKGDASFRKFYRNKKNHSIVVYAIKDKVKNLLIYDAINKILLKNKILAPKLLGQNYKNNYIEVEDFGDDVLNKLLKLKKINKI